MFGSFRGNYDENFLFANNLLFDFGDCFKSGGSAVGECISESDGIAVVVST